MILEVWMRRRFVSDKIERKERLRKRGSMGGWGFG